MLAQLKPVALSRPKGPAHVPPPGQPPRGRAYPGPAIFTFPALDTLLRLRRGRARR